MTGPSPTPDTPQPQPSQVETVTSQQAAAEAQQQNQIRSLASAMTATDPTTYAQVMKGTLTGFTAATLPPMCSIQLAGDTSATIDNVRYIDSYMPVVGDTVLIVKQGSELFVLGQMTEIQSNPTDSGWQSPTLTATWNNSTGSVPVKYRKLFDNGSYKVQIQGRAARTGTGVGLTLFTLPPEYRPSVIRNMVVTRENLAGGANTVQLQINPTTGNVDISGATLDVVGVSVNNGGSWYTSGASSTITGYVRDAPGPPACHPNPSSPSSGAPFCGDTAAGGWPGGHKHDIQHRHDMEHNHTTPDHTHGTTNTNASFPGWVSLDGVEFFL